MKKIFISILGFGFSTTMAFDTVAGSAIEMTTLDNGLKVIVKQDNRSPIFISQVWYGVGASDERWPNTGVSHMLEHMMFKGTQSYKVGEFSEVIARNGGEENAFTSKDYTAYYQKMHKSKLELAIKMEADRMRNLDLDNEEFEKERQVVIEERRQRVEDSPNAKVYEKLKDISFGYGPYKSPVIGYQDDIETMKLEVLQDWYDKYYAPNNATLVVVGDIEASEVVNLAKKYFGNYKRNPDIGAEPKGRSRGLVKNRDLVLAKAKVPFYAMSFSIPSLSAVEVESDAYAIEMLAYILDDKITKQMVRGEQVISNVSVGYNIYDKYSTVFTIGFIPASGETIERGVSGIKEVLRELTDDESDIRDEMKKTVIQIEAGYVFEKDSIDNQSYYLGMLETVGLGYEVGESYVGKMRGVTQDEVKAVALKWLNFENMNAVELKPLEMK